MERRTTGTRDPFASGGRARGRGANKPPPQAFVLDELASIDPRTKPMFGCLAVYAGDRIVFILRERGGGDSDDGVWLGFEPAREVELRARFVRACAIDVFAGRVSGWLKLAASSPEFEDDVLAACTLVRAGDPLIGKIPSAKRTKPRAVLTAKPAKPAKGVKAPKPAKPAKPTKSAT